MNELAEKLLQPVSADKPCGPDLSYDPRFEELETILKGKPEVEIGAVKRPAEPPDWGELRDKSVEFLRASKHLRAAVILCCSLVKTKGLPGFRDGLELVRGLVEQRWAAVYPLLDPDDNNDPTQRLNILSSLTRPRGSDTSGWLNIIDYLYAAPVCQPKGAPPITFDQLEAAKMKASGAEGVPADAPDPAKLGAAIRQSGASDQLAAHQKTLQEALESAQAIDQFLTNTLGAGGTISFEVLQQSLKGMLGSLQPYLAGGAPDGAAAAHGGGAEGAAGGATFGGIPVSGSVRSREDVVRAIDSICEYYRQVEPCSPVPYLLRRAQKIAEMNFVEAVQELNLATVDSLRPSMGSAVPKEAAPDAASA
jgi:type VI secretion system protein ImpA